MEKVDVASPTLSPPPREADVLPAPLPTLDDKVREGCLAQDRVIQMQLQAIQQLQAMQLESQRQLQESQRQLQESERQFSAFRLETQQQFRNVQQQLEILQFNMGAISFNSTAFFPEVPIRPLMNDAGDLPNENEFPALNRDFRNLSALATRNLLSFYNVRLPRGGDAKKLLAAHIGLRERM